MSLQLLDLTGYEKYLQIFNVQAPTLFPVSVFVHPVGPDMFSMMLEACWLLPDLFY